MLLDFLFPKRCIACKSFGDYVCPACFAMISFDVTEVCLVCNKQAIGGMTHPGCRTKYTIDGVLSSIVYAGVVKKLVYTFKYKPYLSDARSFLGELLYEGIIQKEIFAHILTLQPVLMPIPLYKRKALNRGYNQSALLAAELSKKTHLPVIDGLERAKATHSQFSLSRDERRHNIHGAFVLTQQFFPRVKGKHIVLIDDVVTSGATLLEAAKVLKKAGAASVWGVTLAHGR